MFLIPTVVAPSSTHGFGVFTPNFIPAGTLIWTLTEGADLLLSEDEISAVAEPLQSRLRTYCYLDESGVYVLCGDNAKFMNHSFEPNCDDSGTGGTVTLRDIEPGEELTCDYRLFDLESRRDGLDSWRSAPSEAGIEASVEAGLEAD